MEGFVPDDVQPEGLQLEGFTPDSFEPDPQQPKELEKPLFESESLGGRIQTQLQGRLSNVEESTKMMANDEQTYLEAAAQGFGQVIMAWNDVVSEGVLEVLSGMTPDAAEAWLKEQIDTGADKLMSTETAQELYQTYRSLSPRARKDLDAAANIGLALLPMKTKIGSKLVEAGVAAEKKSLGRYLLDQGVSAKKARLAEEGMELPTQTVRNREDSILNTALSIKGITASTPRPKMMAALNTEVARLGKDIKKALAAVPMTISKGTVSLRVNQRLNQFMRDNPAYAGKDLKPSVEKIMRAYQTALKGFNGRPEDLLRIRREFDDNVQLFFKKDVHAGDDSSRQVVAQVRDEMNTLMQELAPDAQIRSAMQRQHHALIAKDNLAFNMAIEKSSVDKLVSKLEHHPYFVTGIATGTGLGANLMQSEALGVGAGLFGAAYLGSRPTTLKAAGSTLETLNPTKSLMVDMLNEQAQELEE